MSFKFLSNENLFNSSIINFSSILLFIFTISIKSQSIVFKFLSSTSFKSCKNLLIALISGKDFGINLVKLYKSIFSPLAFNFAKNKL